jgi:hypothetical protein
MTSAQDCFLQTANGGAVHAGTRAEQRHLTDCCWSADIWKQEEFMDDEALNTSTRKFLKTIGVNSQLAIEKAVHQAIESGKLKGNECLVAHMTLHIAQLELDVKFDGEVRLD